jgi:hypothetical protein
MKFNQILPGEINKVGSFIGSDHLHILPILVSHWHVKAFDKIGKMIRCMFVKKTIIADALRIKTKR